MRALRGTLTVLTVSTCCALAGCRHGNVGPTLGSNARGKVSAAICEPGGFACRPAPPFVGTVRRVAPPNCPRLLPSNTGVQFGADKPKLSLFTLTGCWIGTLKGSPFTIAEYWSGQIGGGVLVQYGRHSPFAMQLGAGAPSVQRFTGESVCWYEQAGAYYQGLNIMTETPMPEATAMSVCPPKQGESATSSSVFGLR